MLRPLTFAIALLLATGCVYTEAYARKDVDAEAAQSVQMANAHHPRWFSSIVWAVMENHGTLQTRELPGEQYLIKNGATFKRYYAITHPSGPNYRAITSGEIWNHNEVYGHQEPTVASELTAIGIPTIDWYFAGTPDLKHDPYHDLKSTVTVRTDAFQPDTLPAECQVYLGLDDDNNAHNGPLSAVSDNILKLVNTLDRSKWFNTPVHGKYPVLLVTWDESFTADNDVLTAFYGKGIKPGYVSSDAYNHYNLCRTLTDNWGLAPLGHGREAKPISDIWN
ncbi:MAG TPA: hypothetical protein V6D47_01495 [Oscillatoriaceae cyanobacterium]